MVESDIVGEQTAGVVNEPGTSIDRGHLGGRGPALGDVLHERRVVRYAMAGQLIAAVFLWGLWLLWARSQPDHATPTLVAASAWTLLTCILLVLVWMKVSIFRPQVVAGWIIGEAVILALLTTAYGSAEDPFYSWAVVAAAAVAVAAPQRLALGLSCVLAIAYVLGHLLGHPADSGLAIVFLLINASALMVIAATMAIGRTAIEQRQGQIEKSRHELLKANEQLEQRAGDAHAVSRVLELVHSTLDIETIAAPLLEMVRSTVRIPSASLQVVDADNKGVLFSVGGADDRARGKVAAGADERAFGCVELMDRGGMIVTLCGEADAIARLTSADHAWLQTTASELAVAVENARLYGLTKRLAVTDELTGLNNYRFLQQRFDEEIWRANRYGKRLSLLLIDVDGFKRVNDLYGHRTGDVVLAELARVVSSVLREVDVIARYGGEEFAIVLPETDAAGAFIVAEKVREAVAAYRFNEAEAQAPLYLTVSIGVATFPVHALDRDTMMRAADDALYSAKRAGKDRVRAARLRLSRLTDETEEGIAE